MKPQHEKTLIDDGIYRAKLAGVTRLHSAFGDRVGLEFELIDGRPGAVLMQSAAASTSTKGKLAGFIRGILGREPEGNQLASIEQLIGATCRILVRQEQSRDGRPYAAIVQTFQ